MSKVLTFFMVIMCAGITVSAQTENDLKPYFEDKNISLKIDMPATKDGVNSGMDSRVFTADALIEAPGKYVDFSNTEEVASAPRRISHRYVDTETQNPGVVRVGPTTTYLKDGLTIEDVLRVLGEPAVVSEREENGNVVTTYEFPRSEGRILIAEFVSGLLVHSRTETRGQVARIYGLNF